MQTTLIPVLLISLCPLPRPSSPYPLSGTASRASNPRQQRRHISTGSTTSRFQIRRPLIQTRTSAHIVPLLHSSPTVASPASPKSNGGHVHPPVSRIVTEAAVKPGIGAIGDDCRPKVSILSAEKLFWGSRIMRSRRLDLFCRHFAFSAQRVQSPQSPTAFHEARRVPARCLAIALAVLGEPRRSSLLPVAIMGVITAVRFVGDSSATYSGCSAEWMSMRPVL